MAILATLVELFLSIPKVLEIVERLLKQRAERLSRKERAERTRRIDEAATATKVSKDLHREAKIEALEKWRSVFSSK